MTGPEQGKTPPGPPHRGSLKRRRGRPGLGCCWGRAPLASRLGKIAPGIAYSSSTGVSQEPWRTLRAKAAEMAPFCLKPCPERGSAQRTFQARLATRQNAGSSQARSVERPRWHNHPLTRQAKGAPAVNQTVAQRPASTAHLPLVRAVFPGLSKKPHSREASLVLSQEAPLGAPHRTGPRLGSPSK